MTSAARESRVRLVGQLRGPAAETGAPRRRRLGLAPRRPGALLLGPVLLIVFWLLGSASGLISPTVFPSLPAVVAKGYALVADGSLVDNLLVSLGRAGIGLGIGVAVGVVLALGSGLSRWGEAIIDGPLQIKRAIPILALIPLAIVWLGIGEQMKITLVALTAIVPVYINTSAALSGADIRFVELAESLSLSRWRYIRKVALPGALPGFFTGLRLSATGSLLVLVVVEQTNAISGIGFLMTQARQFGQVDVITVGLVVYAVLGLVVDTLIRLIERRVLRWRRSVS